MGRKKSPATDAGQGLRAIYRHLWTSNPGLGAQGLFIPAATHKDYPGPIRWGLPTLLISLRSGDSSAWQPEVYPITTHLLT